MPSTIVDVFGRRLQQVRGDLGHLLSEALGGALDRGTEDRTAPTAARPERVRRLVGVALMHRDVVERHTEELADELRGRGLQTLPVRSGAEVHAHGAVGLDAEVRGFGAVRPDHALRLDVQADAHPQEASDRELLPLPDAECVVVDASMRLARASRRATRRTGGCPGARCRGVRRAAARCGAAARGDPCPTSWRGCRRPVHGSRSRTAMVRDRALASTCS